MGQLVARVGVDGWQYISATRWHPAVRPLLKEKDDVRQVQASNHSSCSAVWIQHWVGSNGDDIVASIVKLLIAMNIPQEVANALEGLLASGYTGSVVLHCKDGAVLAAEAERKEKLK